MRHALLILKTLIFGSIAAFGVHYFLLQPFSVEDARMTPDFSKGEVLLVNRLPYFSGVLHRGDVVIYRDVHDSSKKYIGRILGLPGEHVSLNDGILTISGSEKMTKELMINDVMTATLANIGTLDDHEYFVANNEGVIYGNAILDKRYIVGVPALRIYPINKVKHY